VQMETRAQGPQIDLGPLKKAVTDTMESMKEEQSDDDQKMTICKKTLEETARELNSLSSSKASLESKLGTLKNQVALVQEEMKSVKDETQVIEASMVEAKAQRKQETEEFTKTQSELSLSGDLLNRAKAVLEKAFTKKASLLQSSSGNSGSAFEDSLASFISAAPEAPPELAAPSSQAAGGAGVIGMLSTLGAEIKAEQAGGKKEEADSQADFDETMADMQTSLKAMNKDVVGKEAEASRIMETLQDYKGNLGEVVDEEAAAQSKEHALHADCDFLVQNYEERKKARTLEIESVGSAFSILNGADFGGGFLQSQVRKHGDERYE